ncbi:unnamed protein product [Bursaphelenchus okinawaensis]|uniref:MADF domain-containing protein n=1 Tax=Bursaphelenchus okinawaensis TaxID=465554 RepID=A0A811JPZ4_9BILA|nr:unnamed protein product [Bursaphelenchus okinawaensis]CAG9077362.1 unnamed protein product [Bursaphelenchus okinawaensis]
MPPSSPMEEQDFLVRLVKRIEEEPSLYKLEDHNYSNDNVRHQAFLRIKERLIDDGISEEQASVVIIRDKFRILKRRFSSEHRRKGSKSQWPFYQHLKFLIPCVEHAYEQEAMRNVEKRKWSMASSTPRTSPEENDDSSSVSVKETIEQTLNLPRSVTRRGVNPFNKEEEKVVFNADLHTWLRTHTCCGVKTRQFYDQIIEAVTMKNQDIPFPANLEREYTVYAEKYEVMKDEDENYVVYRKGKKVVHEFELFDILYETHQKTAHSRRDVMFKKLNEKYDGISKNLVIMFLKTCRYCELNGIGIPRERSNQIKRNGSTSPPNNYLLDIMRGADENQLGEAQEEEDEEDFGPSKDSNPLSIFLKACDQSIMSYCDSPKTDSNLSNEDKSEFGEVVALAAYQLRQTYLLLRVVNEQRMVICKVNDEDYFPSMKVEHTASDRVNWTPGQIIKAFFGFEQTKTECVVEAVGSLESVQDAFFQAKQKQNPTDNAQTIDNPPEKRLKLNQNGTKIATSDMRNIQNRFEEMEERIRFLEQQVFTQQPSSNVPKIDFMGTGL